MRRVRALLAIALRSQRYSRLASLMAASDHDPSRRALLGAAVALPLASSLRGVGEGGFFAGAAAPVPLDPARRGEDWRRALAAFEAAEGELRRFEAFCSGRPYEEQEALEDECGARGSALYAALRTLLRAPAPNVAALAVKLDLVVAHDVGTLTGGEACLAALRTDAHRLAERAPA